LIAFFSLSISLFSEPAKSNIDDSDFGVSFLG
jgi:hypothetical protein